MLLLQPKYSLWLYYKFINHTCTLWLCMSCVRKTSDNTEDLMFGLIAGQPLSSRKFWLINHSYKRHTWVILADSYDILLFRSITVMILTVIMISHILSVFCPISPRHYLQIVWVRRPEFLKVNNICSKWLIILIPMHAFNSYNSFQEFIKQVAWKIQSKLFIKSRNPNYHCASQ
jgi:hypothetical protein